MRSIKQINAAALRITHFMYFTEHGGRFVAASEIKAILGLTGRVFKMRKESVNEFIVYDYVPEPFTWYEGILNLLPGHAMLGALEQHVVQVRRIAGHR